jgi:hypothetical protein
MTTYAIGEEGFRWFFGVVEDRDDPKKIGRVRVRIYNVHPFTTGGAPDLVNVPTEHLPWATVINSIISAGILGVNNDGVGVSPTGMIVGTSVFGFFADGRECQLPVILGTLAGIVGDKEENELPRSAVGINSAVQIKELTKIDSASPFPGEPSSPYNAKYPYNKVFRTESGHLIEIDDTVSKERIHIMHKTGTYVEIDRDGQVVIKSVDNRFDVTTKDNNVYVGGNVNLYVKGNVNTKVNGSYTLNVDGPIVMNGSTVNINNGTSGAARKGDLVTNDDSAGDQPIKGSSATVFIGG